MNFDDAISAHADWKMKLSRYLMNSDGTLKPEVVGQDNQCALGKWIYGEGKGFSQLPEYATLVSEHAKFHKKAAEIITKIHEKKPVSQEDISISSEYGKISTTVINAIRKMREKTGG